MPRETFCVYNRDGLCARLKALGPKIRAQGGLQDADEYPTLTEILLEIVSVAEVLLEEDYWGVPDAATS